MMQNPVYSRVPHPLAWLAPGGACCHAPPSGPVTSCTVVEVRGTSTIVAFSRPTSVPGLSGARLTATVPTAHLRAPRG